MSDVPEFEKIIQSIPEAPPLPPPTGKIVRVDKAEAIIEAIEQAEEHSTVLIAKGHYLMPRDCLLTTSHVSIRGETGRREDVILDSNMEFEDTTPKFSTTLGAPGIIKISKASHVTVADLTFANNPKYGLEYFGGGSIHHLKVYNVKFHNIWARGIKGTGSYHEGDKLVVPLDFMSAEEFEAVRPMHGEIRHCLFVADTVKRNDQDGSDGDYIAGMDLMGVRAFTIAQNTFIGIRGKNGGARGGVFIWHNADDVTVEENHFYHCDKGVALGNPASQDKRKYHIRDSVIRNNTIIGGSNKAIEVDYGNNVSVVGNMIESHDRRDYAAIQILHMEAEALIQKNTLQLHGEDPFKCDPCVVIKENHPLQ